MGCIYCGINTSELTVVVLTVNTGQWTEEKLMTNIADCLEESVILIMYVGNLRRPSMNEDKLNFGRVLNESGPNGFITSDICHNYGSISGCDMGCPALISGDCELKDAECKDLYDEVKQFELGE